MGRVGLMSLVRMSLVRLRLRFYDHIDSAILGAAVHGLVGGERLLITVAYGLNVHGIATGVGYKVFSHGRGAIRGELLIECFFAQRICMTLDDNRTLSKTVDHSL